MSDRDDSVRPTDESVVAFSEALHRGEIMTPEEWTARHPNSLPVISELSVVALLHSMRGSVLADTAPYRHPSQPLERDNVFANHRVLDRLGAGGMGTVYLVEHPILKERRALKVMSQRFAEHPKMAERFLQEAQLLAQLKSEGIVRVLECGWENKQPYLIMEYIPGSNLDQWVREHGRLSASQACEMILQAARALDVAHRHNIVHRDVKPSNLMRTPDGRIKILDLGLAQPQSHRGEQRTEPGVLLGSPGYCAPEQACDSHRSTPRSDLFSLGCTLYFLMTAEAPFSHQQTLSWRSASGSPVPLPPLPSETPPDVQKILGRLITARPEDRFRSALDLASALEEVLQPRPSKKFAPLVAAAVGVSLVVGIGMGIWQFSQRNSIEQESASAATTAKSSTSTMSNVVTLNVQPQREDFPIQVKLLGGRTDPKTGSTKLVDGQPFEVEVTPSQDCYIEVWYEDERGRFLQLHPRGTWSPLKLLANQPHRFPPREADYDFIAHASEGAEFVHVIASPTPLPQVTQSGPTLKDIVDRERTQLKAQPRSAEVVPKATRYSVSHGPIRIDQVTEN